MESNYGCSICMNRLFDSAIGALSCGHVFHFQCIHEWLSATEIGTRKACPTCRKRVKIYDIIQLFGFSKADHEDVEFAGDTDTKKFEELTILRTENEALKKDIKVLLDESEVERLNNQNEKLQMEIDRLTAELRIKNQELMNCRLTMAEFSTLIPKLEEQHKKSTDEIKDAIEKYKELRDAILKKKK